MLKDWFLYNNRFCAVEHTFNPKGEESYHFLQLRKKGKELLLDSKKTFSTYEELISFLKESKQQQIVLVFNNLQVLTKNINKPENYQNIFQLAYPNLNSTEFYYQYEKTNGNIFLAVTRKSYIDNLIELYTSNQISVLDFSLGNLSVFEIANLFQTTEVTTSNSKILIEHEKVINITSKHFNNKNYDINGLNIDSNSLLSLGIIISFYLKTNFYHNKTHFDSFKNKVIFNKGYKTALSFCLVILFINFLFFSSYYKEVTKLNSYIEINNSTKENLKLLSDEVIEKEKLLNQIQNYSSISIAKYIDEITCTTPNTILLTELNYQPFLNTIKEEKEIKNELKTIRISGNFKSNSDISNWVDIIEKLTWVKEVSRLKIENTKQTSKFHFSIIIKNEL
ncbi:hypothetical protein [Tenacibaculum singaporense]|uniref:hypothetical protein n=1 Tax=Tenacibaculum singaporense TaxID=2358479 RepID=UPI000F67B4D0|nr:hypothetical protein [Tenacibaculum singaporense]RSC92199.1 hypothetical protein EI424_14260 [Tenacibaculum singaporense]